MQNQPHSHTVYSHVNFTEAFKADLQRAVCLVLIQSPFLTIRRINELAPDIESCTKRRVRVCVFAQQPDSSYEIQEEDRRYREAAKHLLLSLGAHVTFRSDVHEKLAVIDDSVFWDGSLNILSYRRTSERMTRWISREKVDEAVNTHRLDSCLTCASKVQPMKDIIAKRRKSLGMSQKALSLKANVSQSIISDLERGKREVTLNSLNRILAELQLGLRSLPRHLLPSIDDIIHEADI